MSHNICITATKGKQIVDFPVYQTTTEDTRLILQQGKKHAIQAYCDSVIKRCGDTNHATQLNEFIRVYTAAKYKIEIHSN